MSIFWFSHLPVWAMFASLVAHFLAGTAVGMLYFRNIWWSAQHIIVGKHMTMLVASTLLRFLMLGAVLALTSLEGAPPLLSVVIGLLGARSLVIHNVRMTP